MIKELNLSIAKSGKILQWKLESTYKTRQQEKKISGQLCYSITINSQPIQMKKIESCEFKLSSILAF